MCNLCDPETKQKEMEFLKYKAEELRTMANFYDALRVGSVKPHTSGANVIRAQAKIIVRFLVEEWV